MYRTASQQRPGLDAVRQNAAIARQIANFASNDASVSEALVKDQHWLQQSWFAMVANLDEIAKSFDQRSIAFRNSYSKYLERRQMAVEILAHFSQDLQILKQIPLVPSLLPSGFASNDASEVTLFSWISQVDPEHSLTDLADDAERSLGNFREDLLKNIDEQKQIAFSN